MKKICFVGGPGAGKTVLAKSLLQALRQKGYRVEWAREYARDFIIKYGPMRSVVDQFLILQGQKEREEKAEKKNPEFVICDCATYLSYIYSFLYEPKHSDQKAWKKHQLISEIIWDGIRSELYKYNHVFFLPLEFLPEEDGTRLYTDKTNQISNQIKKFLNSKKIKHFEIKGTPKERLKRVFEIIR